MGIRRAGRGKDQIVTNGIRPDNPVELWLDFETYILRGHRMLAAHQLGRIIEAADDPALVTAQVAQFVARQLTETQDIPRFRILSSKGKRAPHDDAYELVSLYWDGSPASMRAADRLARTVWRKRPDWWPGNVMRDLLDLLPYNPDR